MNKQQVRYLLTILKSEYENAYKDFETIATTWDAMFKNDDYKYVAKAVYRYIETDVTTYKPNIGQLKALAKEIKKEEWHKVNDVPQIENKRDIVPMPENIKEKLEKYYQRFELKGEN